MNTYRYVLVHRLLHWLVVLGVFAMLTLGFMFWFYGSFNGLKETFGIEITNQIYLYHKSFGVVVLGLMVLRVAVKLATTKPEYQRPLTGFERAASGAVHGLFYVLLIAMPMLGWAYTATGGFPVQFFGWELPGLLGKDVELSKTLFEFHRWTARIIAVLIAIHVAAALRHALIKRDGVLARMGFF